MKSVLKKTLGLVLFLGFIFLCSCRNEPSIENVPVSEIDVSQPPKIPEPKVVESPYGDDGVYKISEIRYYNAVVPFGAVELGCTENECRFYVPKMLRWNVIQFLEKYFPYQKMAKITDGDSFKIFAEFKPEFQDDAIFPTLDVNVMKPTTETIIEVSVFWNKQKNYFEWIYSDPAYRVRVNQMSEKLEAEIKMENEVFESEHQPQPSHDSPGLMVDPRSRRDF